MDKARLVRLRAERADDASFLFNLFRETRVGVLDAFDSTLVEMLLRQQFAGQAMTYRAHYPKARCDIVEDAAGTPIGRIVVDQTATAITLVDIALLPSHRGQGIGTRLVRNSLAAAQAAGLPVRLSVRPDNPAQRLYARLGFVAVGATQVDVAMEWNAR